MTVRHALEYAAYWPVARLLRSLPHPVSRRLGSALGALAHAVDARRRRTARENLRHAFGRELSEKEIRRLTLACMQQMTMTSMEALFTPRVISEWSWPSYIRLRGLGRALDLLLARRGAILITGHYGNWELLGFLLATLGFKIEAVMRPLDNPYINDFLESVRRAAWQAGRQLQVFRVAGAGADHPFLIHVPEGRYLKAVFARVV